MKWQLWNTNISLYALWHVFMYLCVIFVYIIVSLRCVSRSNKDFIQMFCSLLASLLFQSVGCAGNSSCWLWVRTVSNQVLCLYLAMFKVVICVLVLRNTDLSDEKWNNCKTNMHDYEAHHMCIIDFLRYRMNEIYTYSH